MFRLPHVASSCCFFFFFFLWFMTVVRVFLLFLCHLVHVCCLCFFFVFMWFKAVARVSSFLCILWLLLVFFLLHVVHGCCRILSSYADESPRALARSHSRQHRTTERYPNVGIHNCTQPAGLACGLFTAANYLIRHHTSALGKHFSLMEQYAFYSNF